MGRELRRVPPNWNHPLEVPVEADPYRHISRVWSSLRYRPLRNRFFPEVAAAWRANLAKWETGWRPSYCDESERHLEYWEFDPPPRREDFIPWRPEEATWYQVWETVTDGTPVTPPFETPEQLIEHLINHGDCFPQQPQQWPRRRWTYAEAEQFVNKTRWSPGLVKDDKGVREGWEQAPELRQ